MCRSHDQGHRRCVNSPQKQNSEALRKAIGYQAKKAGKSSAEWKSENPELLEIIQDTYNDKLSQLKEQEHLANPDSKATTPSLSYVDENNEETITGVVTPLQAAKIRPIEEYGFKGVKEARIYGGTTDFDEYVESCRDTARELTKEELNAVEAYTYDAYQSLNSYLLGKDTDDVFYKDAHNGKKNWNDSFSPYMCMFTDEEDLADYATALDSALSKRNEEHQILYRGMAFYPEDDDLRPLGVRKNEVASNYGLGNEIVFDTYSSTSVIPEVASSFSRMNMKTNPSFVGVQYEIRTNAGIPVAHISGNNDEREILLPRGIRYKVVNSYWDEGDYKYESLYYEGTREIKANKNPNMLIVQLIEVDEHGEEVNNTNDYIAPPIQRLNNAA